jgi:hypothetical protein
MAYNNPPPPNFIGNPNNRSNMSPMHNTHNNYGSSSSFSQHADNGNRENVGWNDDNRGILQHGYSRPPDYNNMNDSKYNHNHFSHRSNNYHDRHTSSHHHNNNNNNNNNNSNIVKRAAKRRVKHDLPGPAGDYFRQKKQQKSAAAAAANRKTALSSKISSSSQNEKKQQEMQLVANAEKNDEVVPNNNDSLVDSKLIKIKRGDDDDSNDDNNNSNNFIQQQLQQLQQRDEQLFHDHSSDLHECNAWNLMCTTLNRIVQPSNLLLHNHHHNLHHKHPNTTSAYTTYKLKLRSSIPSSKYALIHEIHDGLYDKCHLDKHLYSSDLCIPKILVGYVASVQCHAHSDWTALLVDEMHGVHKYYYNGGSGGNSSSSKRSKNAGRGIVCWIEERLVKQHSNWIRPGAVWMIEGAKLALFSSLEDDDDDDDEEEEEYDVNNPTTAIATSTSEVVDISPSTENSRGGGSIDRMILVGESSMVYAWTPEEASSTFTHEEFSSLMERRCNLGLHNDDDDDSEELLQLHDQKENAAAGNAVTKCGVDDTSPLKYDARKKVVGNDGQIDEILIKCSPSNDSSTAKLSSNGSNGSKGSGDKTNSAETVQIIDVTNEHSLNKEKQKAEGQALEACSLINEVRDEANDISESVVDAESQDATAELSVKVNTPNPYTKKNDEVKVVSSCQEASSAGKEMAKPTDRDGVDSSLLVCSDAKRMAAKSPKGQQTTLDIDDAPQIADETAQPQHVDIDDSFDDMLDDDSLDEGMPIRSEGASTNILNASTDAVEGNSFDDMLDEDSLEKETPRKIEKKSAGDDTPGGESFDMMLDNDSDDNVVALFQARDKSSSNNLFSPSQGLSVLDKDDLLDLGDEDDDDF